MYNTLTTGSENICLSVFLSVLLLSTNHTMHTYLTGQTGMDRQFQLLSRNKAPPSKFMSANLPVNKNKNRYANVLPYDDTRVHLNAQLGTDGSDYINANYIDGYMQKRLFIATQAPIPDTIPDFWRMIWEQDCCTIVMLSNETQSGKVRHFREKSIHCLSVDTFITVSLSFFNSASANKNCWKTMVIPRLRCNKTHLSINHVTVLIQICISSYQYDIIDILTGESTQILARKGTYNDCKPCH